MTDDTRALELTDPRAMRALAHPLRLRILDVIREQGSATATQLAEALDESTSSTSYHLSQLAKHGFIEEEPTPGRERPWRAKAQGLRWSAGRGRSPEYLAAARLLRSRVLDLHAQVLEDFLLAEDDLDPDWQESVVISDSRLHVTAEELALIGEQLVELLEPYRRPDPDARPDGARRVSFITYGLPHPDSRGGS